ncbi:hypothetical protein Y032_0015g2572 [Ancylostoma ceylanicum]|uniref:Uncharacterized protein n=1 Tax=Ancylostoma ceylanicum TaxID=53326 RepID=A0A016V971_9BILA|nr:hypothetical protein Y032_0015g2572 [Ancylostoma ceylanicum]
MIEDNCYCSRSTARYAGGGPAAPGTGMHDDKITNNTTREHWWNGPSGMTAQRRLISKIGRATPSARGQAWELQCSNARGGTRSQGTESRTARQYLLTNALLYKYYHAIRTKLITGLISWY